MTPHFVLAQLYILRNQVDATILAMQELLNEPPTGPCAHAETVDEGSTLGHVRRRCQNPSCRALVEHAV
jgi:hypothetical protein